MEKKASARAGASWLVFSTSGRKGSRRESQRKKQPRRGGSDASTAGKNGTSRWLQDRQERLPIADEKKRRLKKGNKSPRKKNSRKIPPAPKRSQFVWNSKHGIEVKPVANVTPLVRGREELKGARGVSKSSRTKQGTRTPGTTVGVHERRRARSIHRGTIPMAKECSKNIQGESAERREGSCKQNTGEARTQQVRTERRCARRRLEPDSLRRTEAGETSD